MKFLLEYKDYSNRTRSKEITLDEAVELYFKNCAYWRLHNPYKEYGDEFGTLSRAVIGPGGRYSYATINPKGKLRDSQNTSNEYTNLVDNILESWEGYPNRSESVIMSKGHFRPMIMIPYYDSNIAVCPKDDFWWSFDGITDTGIWMNDFNENFLSLFSGQYKHKVDHQALDLENIDKQSSKEDLKKIDINISNKICNIVNSGPQKPDIWKTCFTINNLWKELNKVKNRDLNLYEFLNLALDPEKNGFKVVKSQDFQEMSGNNKECWSDGIFLVIHKGYGEEETPYKNFYNKIISDDRYKF